MKKELRINNFKDNNAVDNNPTENKIVSQKSSNDSNHMIQSDHDKSQKDIDLKNPIETPQTDKKPLSTHALYCDCQNDKFENLNCF